MRQHARKTQTTHRDLVASVPDEHEANEPRAVLNI
ncbi:MAG: hypothetical protein JWM53_614 [bacterium]|nr:hypothetical protein [bacterium]